MAVARTRGNPVRRGPAPTPRALGVLSALLWALLVWPAIGQDAAVPQWEQALYGRWEGQQVLLHNGSLFFGKLALGDLDGDGDPDLLLGKQDGHIDRFENVGRAGAPRWRLIQENMRALRPPREGDAAPQEVVIDGGAHAAPTLVDIDQDEDLDLFIGTEDGRLLLYRNVGNPILPAFVLITEQFVGTGFGRNLVPAFADVDDDRAPDLFLGNRAGEVYLLPNSGTQRRAVFCVQLPPRDALPDEEPPCRPVPTRLLSIAPENNAAPGLVDWDGDGDPDLFVGKSDGTLDYHENKGGRVEPDWRLELARFLAIDDGGFAAPAFVDANDDGKPDVAIGSSANQVSLYTAKGTGSPRDVWKESGNLLDVRRLSVSLRQLVVTSGDLDGDGDLDLVAGTRAGRMLWVENTGSAEAPEWRVGTDNLVSGAPRENSAPWLADLDGDGDLDLLVGGVDGRIWLLSNRGTNEAPRFSLDATGYAGIDVGNDSVPATVDIDGDGDLDLFVGNRRGVVVYYRNEGTASAPDFRLTSTRFGGVTVGVGAAPAFFDWNADQRLDLVVGSRPGTLVLDVNENEPGDAELANWRLQGETWQPFRTSGYSAPHFADLNADGRPDLLVGDVDGNLRLWWNRAGVAAAPEEPAAADTAAAPADGTGAAPGLPSFESQSGLSALTGEEGSAAGGAASATQILLSEPQPVGPLAPVFTLATKTLGGLAFEGRVTPAVGDLDGDGDADLIIGTADGKLAHYRNDGPPEEPKFSAQAENVGDFAGGGNPVPLLHDLDGDGALDLIVGTESGQVQFFRNTGSAQAPAFTRVEEALASINVGRKAAPAVALLNDDAQPDLLVGAFSGQLWAFVQAGEAQSLNFERLDRRFMGIDVGVAATPVVGDVDRDEQPDLLVGSDQGNIAVFGGSGAEEGKAPSWKAGPDYLKGLKFPFGTSPRLVDMDDDGDMDLLTGSEKGTIYFYRNDALNR